VAEAHADPPIALHVSAPTPPLGDALATLLAGRLGERRLPAFVLNGAQGQAEPRARDLGAHSLVRITVSAQGSVLVAQGDLLGTWVNFFSGRTPTRPPTPAAALRAQVPLDDGLRSWLPGGVTMDAAAARAEAPDAGVALPRTGVALRVGLALTSASSREAALADAPERAAVFALEHGPWCRLVGGQFTPVLLTGLEPTSPTTWTLHARSAALAQALAHTLDGKAALAATPYRALLAPVKAASAVEADVRVELRSPFPDLAAALCHPALTASAGGPYQPGERPDLLTASLGWTVGDPGPSGALVLSRAPEHAVRSRFERGELDVQLGTSHVNGPAQSAPRLYASYLVYAPERVGADFPERAGPALLSVPRLLEGPVEPMSSLLPAALMPATPGSPEAPAPARPRRTLSLGYEKGNDVQRAAANRLLVALHDRGLSLSLVPLERGALWARWAHHDFDVLLLSVLLPRAPAAALGVVLELAGHPELMPSELSALDDAGQRAVAAQNQARGLAPKLPLLPLFVQGPRVEVSGSTAGLTFDDLGVPLLNLLWLRGP
jgi:hypothetical protein